MSRTIRPSSSGRGDLKICKPPCPRKSVRYGKHREEPDTDGSNTATALWTKYRPARAAAGDAAGGAAGAAAAAWTRPTASASGAVRSIRAKPHATRRSPARRASSTRRRSDPGSPVPRSTATTRAPGYASAARRSRRTASASASARMPFGETSRGSTRPRRRTRRTTRRAFGGCPRRRAGAPRDGAEDTRRLWPPTVRLWGRAARCSVVVDRAFLVPTLGPGLSQDTPAAVNVSGGRAQVELRAACREPRCRQGPPRRLLPDARLRGARSSWTSVAEESAADAATLFCYVVDPAEADVPRRRGLRGRSARCRCSSRCRRRAAAGLRASASSALPLRRLLSRAMSRAPGAVLRAAVLDGRRQRPERQQRKSGLADDAAARPRRPDRRALKGGARLRCRRHRVVGQG